MKVKYLPTKLEVEHPIIGRWYKIADFNVQPKEFQTYRYTIRSVVCSEYRRTVYPMFFCARYTWMYNKEAFSDSNLIPLPLHKRAYHATKRIMAAWISRWLCGSI